MPASATLQYEVDTLGKLIAGIRPDQMSAPTPCAEWTVRDLVNHFVGGAGMFTAAYNGEAVATDADAETPDLVGDDPAGAFNAAIAVFEAAVDQPGAMERTITLPFGAMPGATALEILKFDLLVHCWDLATATGQSFDPPADVVAHADAMARQMIAPEVRAGGSFGSEAPCAATAAPIERLAAFTGRAV
jgi:uncharacterized protein (TIGR03086 family)